MNLTHLTRDQIICIIDAVFYSDKQKEWKSAQKNYTQYCELLRIAARYGESQLTRLSNRENLILFLQQHEKTVNRVDLNAKTLKEKVLEYFPGLRHKR